MAIVYVYDLLDSRNARGSNRLTSKAGGLLSNTKLLLKQSYRHPKAPDYLDRKKPLLVREKRLLGR